MKCVFLIACVNKKKTSKMPAAKLYVSDWFQKASRLVKATGHPWFILSAKHGLLDPDKTIDPYNQTLNGMPSGMRRAWAEKVKMQMETESKFHCADAVVILAGENYRENLMPYLEKRFANVTIPMKGLRIGEQLRWLKDANIKNILPQ
ncbi:MAG: hypothetical protein OXF09_00005 [Hyphomicrobiales bacterium]|nr:hypothetical protein [Hyphomicrobiales bacterium]